MSSGRALPGGLSSVLVLLGLAAVLPGGGCARSPAPLPPPVPVDPAVVESLLESLEREQRSIRRYQSFIRIRGRGAEGSFDARLVLLFERPESLRVELLGAFGGTRWSAVTSADGILVVFPGRGEYVREEEVDEVVGRLLGVPLTTREVMAILSGAGVPGATGRGAVGVRRGELVQVAIGGGIHLDVGPDGQLARARTPDYEVSYPTSWRRRGRQVPDRIAITSEELRATLSVESIDVNIELDPEAFELTEPPDGRRLRPAEIDGEAVFVLERKPEGGLR